MIRLAIIILCASAASALAQKFEVASIKPSTPAEQGVLYHYPGARLRTTGMTVRYLIEYAYSITDRQLLGGPDWLDTARFDIDAKPEAPPEEQAGSGRAGKQRAHQDHAPRPLSRSLPPANSFRSEGASGL